MKPELYNDKTFLNFEIMTQSSRQSQPHGHLILQESSRKKIMFSFQTNKTILEQKRSCNRIKAM